MFVYSTGKLKIALVPATSLPTPLSFTISFYFIKEQVGFQCFINARLNAPLRIKNILFWCHELASSFLRSFSFERFSAIFHNNNTSFGSTSILSNVRSRMILILCSTVSKSFKATFKLSVALSC